MYQGIQRVNCSQEEYFKLDGVSASDMKKVIVADMDTSAMKKETAKTRSMLIGSAVDTVITEPDLFNTRFCVLDEGQDVPTTKLQELFAEMVLRGMGHVEAHAKFYKRTSKDAADKLLKSLEQYLFLTPTYGDRILTKAEMARVDAMYDNIITQRDCPLLSVPKENRQVVLRGEYVSPHGVIVVKGMADFILDDETIDLKTTSRLDNAVDTVGMFLYDLQVLHYSLLAATRKQGIFFQESVSPFQHAYLNITGQCADENLHNLLVGVLDRIAYSKATGNWGKMENFA